MIDSSQNPEEEKEATSLPDWRLELKKRLQQHSSQNRSQTEEEEREPGQEEEARPEESPETPEGDRSGSGIISPSGEVQASQTGGAETKESAEEGQREHPPARKPPEEREAEKSVRIDDAAGQVFEYKLKEEKSRTPLENPVLAWEKPSRPGSPLLEKPLDRPTRKASDESCAKPAANRTVPTREKPKKSRKEISPSRPDRQLSLNLPQPEFRKDETERVFAEQETKREAPRVSREILFSRFLSGLIDLTLALGLGIGFMLLATWLARFEIFSFRAAVWVGTLTFFFYFLNSAFFLITLAQTPGMLRTELKLQADSEEAEGAIGSILIRVLLFPVTAISLVGLLWAIFDRDCRTWHDLASHTRVTPVEKRTRPAGY